MAERGALRSPDGAKRNPGFPQTSSTVILRRPPQAALEGSDQPFPLHVVAGEELQPTPSLISVLTTVPNAQNHYLVSLAQIQITQQIRRAAEWYDQFTNT